MSTPMGVSNVAGRPSSVAAPWDWTFKSHPWEFMVKLLSDELIKSQLCKNPRFYKDQTKFWSKGKIDRSKPRFCRFCKCDLRYRFLNMKYVAQFIPFINIFTFFVISFIHGNISWYCKQLILRTKNFLQCNQMSSEIWLSLFSISSQLIYILHWTETYFWWPYE